MTTKVGRNDAQTIRNGILLALRSPNGVFKETSDMMARAVSYSILQAECSGAAVSDSLCQVVRFAVNALVNVDKDVTHAVKGITVGVLRGTREFGPAARRTLFHVASSIIHETIEAQGDLQQAFRGLVKGAIHSAHDLGMDESSAASAAVAYALDAADESSPVAAALIRMSAADSIDGVRFVLHGSPYERKPT